MRRILLSLFALVAAGLPAVAAAVPPIEHWTLDSGAKVYFVRNENLPIADIRLTFDAAGARDGELPGLARLTNSLLDQGNGGLDAGEIARRLETVGARLSGGSERDMAWLHLRSLTEPSALEPAIDTLALILGSPEFPEPAFARQKARMLVGLQAVKQSPDALGDRAFYRAVYGSHPYAMPPSGTEESLQRITREHVVSFYRQYYTKGNAVIAIVGALERPQAEALARELADALPDGKAPPPLPPVAPPDQARSERVPFDSAQTHIMIGQPAIARDSADIYAFTVGNHILGGGGLVSLLTTIMRDQRGLSYSTSTGFVPSARPGPFIMQTQVRNESAGEAVQVLRETFAEFLREGPTQQQLNLAIRNITGSFPLNLDSNSDIVGYLSVIGFYGLPLDYLETYPERIRSVTAKDVQAAFQRHLNPETLATVLVGPAPAAAAR
jgi:zinc protease